MQDPLQRWQGSELTHDDNMQTETNATVLINFNIGTSLCFIDAHSNKLSTDFWHTAKYGANTVTNPRGSVLSDG